MADTGDVNEYSGRDKQNYLTWSRSTHITTSVTFDSEEAQEKSDWTEVEKRLERTRLLCLSHHR